MSEVELENAHRFLKKDINNTVRSMKYVDMYNCVVFSRSSPKVHEEIGLRAFLWVH